MEPPWKKNLSFFVGKKKSGIIYLKNLPQVCPDVVLYETDEVMYEK